MRLPCWRAVWAACGFLLVADAQGADYSGPALTLPDAVRHALDKRPELVAFAFTLREREAGRDTAAQRPALELDVALEDALGTGALSGFEAAQATLQLSQVIELGDKRSGRLAVADAELQSVGTARSIEQLDIVADVARRFVEVVRAQERHALALESLRLAEQTRAIVQSRVEAARVPLAEGARAAATVVDARVGLRDAELDLDIARRALAAATGEREASFGRASGDLSALSTVAPLEKLHAKLEQSPALVQFADEERLRDAQLRLAQLQQRADLRASVGVRRLQQSDDFALIAGVSMPLFQQRRAQPELDAARARRGRIGSDRESLLLKLQYALYSQYQQLGRSRELAAILQQDLIPQLESALALTSDAYDRGRYSYQDLLTAQRELLAGRSRLLETFADYQLLRIEIERLSASSLDAAGALR